jgi:hypothetical protein
MLCQCYRSRNESSLINRPLKVLAVKVVCAGEQSVVIVEYYIKIGSFKDRSTAL